MGLLGETSVNDGCRGRLTKEARKGGAGCDLESREVGMGERGEKRRGRGGVMGRRSNGTFRKKSEK